MIDNQQESIDPTSFKCSLCHDLASAFAPTASPAETYTIIFDYLAKVVDYDYSTLFIKVEDTLQAVACRGFNPEEEKEVLALNFPWEHAPLFNRLREGNPVVIGDVSQYQNFQDKTKEGKIKSWIGVPFFVNNQLLALLTVDKGEENFYTEKDSLWLKSFAAFSALNIERIQHYLELQRKYSEKDSLLRISSSLIKSQSLTDTMQIIFEETSKLFAGSSGTVLYLDEKSNRLKIAAAVGIDPQEVQKLNVEGIGLDQGTFKYIKDTHEMIEIPDTSNNPRIDHSFGHVPKSLTNIPLVMDNTILGAITLNTIPKNDEERNLLRSLANLASVSIKSSLIFERNKNLLAELNNIIEIIKSTTTLYDTERVLEIISEEVHKHYRALYTSIFLLDKDGKELVYKCGSGFGWEDLKDKFKINLEGKGITAWVARNQKPLLVNDVTKDERFLGSAKTKNVRSEMAIPITIKGEIIGVWDIESEELNAFSNDHLLIFQILSDHLAMIIQNSTIYEQVKQAAIRDGLTGLYNHRHFYQLLDDSLNRLHRYSGYLTMFMIDINDFKKYNDTFGHLEGDLILKRVAKIFVENCRNIDIIARYGGDEFTILLPNTRLSDARIVALRLWTKARENNISISLGVVSLSKAYMLSREELLKQADQAMYRAKKAGGGIEISNKQ